VLQEQEEIWNAFRAALFDKPPLQGQRLSVGNDTETPDLQCSHGTRRRYTWLESKDSRYFFTSAMN
jgi:hypothetical protein